MDSTHASIIKSLNKATWIIIIVIILAALWLTWYIKNRTTVPAFMLDQSDYGPQPPTPRNPLAGANTSN